jgi:hypothetical protein
MLRPYMPKLTIRVLHRAAVCNAAFTAALDRCPCCYLQQAALSVQKDGLYLYRSIIPPALPRLAFVGSEVSTLDNILTAGLQAEWLAEHWCGSAVLPSPEEMAADIQKQIK